MPLYNTLNIQTVNSHNFQVFRLIFWMLCGVWDCHRLGLVVGSTSSKSATFTSDSWAQRTQIWSWPNCLWSWPNRMAGKRQETHLLALRCSFDRKWTGVFDQLLKLLTEGGTVALWSFTINMLFHHVTKKQRLNFFSFWVITYWQIWTYQVFCLLMLYGHLWLRQI